MALVEDATVASTAADTMEGAGAITGGAAEVGAIQVGVGDSGLDSAGDGHTGIHTAPLGGDTPILTTIQIVLLATTVLITGTTPILRHQIPGHKLGATRHLLRDHPRAQDLRTIRAVMMRMMSRAVPSFLSIG